jgi:hypothetical protein
MLMYRVSNLGKIVVYVTDTAAVSDLMFTAEYQILTVSPLETYEL